jgi:hypothetical protein
MRYLMKARVIPGKAAALKQALDDRTFGSGFPFGDLGEAIRECTVDGHGTLRWIETCYCREYSNVAMVMEIEYFEPYLHAIEIGDARDPRFCDGYPHCNDCRCTDGIRLPGTPFSEYIQQLIVEEEQQPVAHADIRPTHWTGWRGKVQTPDEQQRNAAASPLPLDTGS